MQSESHNGYKFIECFKELQKKTPDELRLRIENVVNFSKDEIEVRIESIKSELDECLVQSLEKCEILKEKLKSLNENIDLSTNEDILFDQVHWIILEKKAQELHFKNKKFYEILNKVYFERKKVNFKKLQKKFGRLDTITEKEMQQKKELLNQMLNNARDSLDRLELRSVTELLSLVRPPKLVELVSESLCVLLNIQHPSWLVFRKTFIKNKSQMLELLLTFDIQNLTEQKLGKLKTYIDNPVFTLENIGRVSVAAANLANYVINLTRYCELNNETKNLDF